MNQTIHKRKHSHLQFLIDQQHLLTHNIRKISTQHRDISSSFGVIWDSVPHYGLGLGKEKHIFSRALVSAYSLIQLAHDCNNQIFQRRAILPKLRLHKGSVAQPLITTFRAFPLGVEISYGKGRIPNQTSLDKSKRNCFK